MKNRNTVQWLVISGLTEALKDKSFSDFMDDKWKGKDKVDIQLSVEGQEIDVEYLCKIWQEQIDEAINKAAVELVNEKFNNISDFVHNIEKEVTAQAREKLGLEPDEYDY